MSAMTDDPFGRMLAKLDLIEVTFALALKRAKRRSFWLGWLAGFLGAEIARLIW